MKSFQIFGSEEVVRQISQLALLTSLLLAFLCGDMLRTWLIQFASLMLHSRRDELIMKFMKFRLTYIRMPEETLIED